MRPGRLTSILFGSGSKSAENVPYRTWSILCRNRRAEPVSRKEDIKDEASSSPESTSQNTSSQPVYTSDQGAIALDQPIREGGALVLKFANIDASEAVNCTSATKFSVQLLDGDKNNALAVSIFPKSGWVFLSTPKGEAKFNRPFKDLFHSKTEHSLIVHREVNQFRFLCDFSLVGTVVADKTTPTTASYDLGVNSPFKGPISAIGYSSVAQLFTELPPYGSTFPIVDKDTLYQQLLACEPNDATYLSNTLTSIRAEITAFNFSRSGITWRCYRDLKVGWNDVAWDLNPRCIMVARTVVDNPGPTQPGTSYIAFGPSSRYQAQICLAPNKSVIFTGNDVPSLETQGSLQLSHALHSPGEHSVVFMNAGGKLYIMVDFCTAVVFRSTLTQQPSEIYFDVLGNGMLEVDFYLFGK